MTVAAWSGTLVDWRDALDGLKAWIDPALGRAETRASAAAFIDGVLSSAERKTGWMLAEQAGHARPYRMQSLLGRSSWSADALRDHVRDYVVDALGDPSGVLVVDETGFLKKGTQLGRCSAAVLGNGWAGRELPDRRVRLLCQPLGPGADRPAALPTQGLGRGS